MDIPAAWTLEAGGKAIGREFAFRDFATAFAFMTDMAIFSEGIDHHPEWTNVYNRVQVRLTTHSAQALTDLDLAWARHADGVFSSLYRPA